MNKVTPNPRENWLAVTAAYSAINDYAHGLKCGPSLLKRIIKDNLWCEFVTPRGLLVKHERFADFLTQAPTRGMGVSIDMARHMCATDPETLALLDDVLTGEGSGDLS